ncbi:MAG: hypothetical protein JWL77_1668 [Chthonomonadaceae bacterium]|nr:hypothetical protein [Chthonomonadaceae bacterium]
MSRLLDRLRDILIKPEPPLPSKVLVGERECFALLPTGATVCIKVSTAYDLPYPFAASAGFVGQIVSEIHAINPDLKIVLTEGGVGSQPILPIAEKHGLTTLPGVTFVDAETTEPIFVTNPNPQPFQVDGFWLPRHWVEADCRILLTTCKLRSHHWRRWFSGGTRNLIGLLPRKEYKLSESRRNMRSSLHKQGMDAMVADLYATTGRDVLTILDCRLLARQDEHIPLRFVRNVDAVVVESDPARADERMAKILKLPFAPPYLSMIAEAEQAQENTAATPAGSEPASSSRTG